MKERLSLKKIFLVFLLLCLVFIGLPSYLSSKKEPVGEGEEELIPSDLLTARQEYSGEEVVVRGKAVLAPVVCQSKSCPVDDRCCGCPDERELLLTDPGRILTSGSKQRLRLLDSRSQSFCQRQPLSCDYDCQDWVEGTIYEVRGTFRAEAAPPSWEMSLDQYLQVERKSLVRKVGLVEMVGNFWDDLGRLLEGLRKSGGFVLD